MLNKLKGLFTPKIRKYLYRVANAALAVAVGYNLVNDNEVALWLLAINALLGLADANVEEAPGPADGAA